MRPERSGGIDTLVNNASGFGSTDDEAGWEKSLAIDLMAAVRATRAATPFLEKSDAASILNISSTSAFHPSVRTTPYGVAKAAVIQYTRDRAAALAPQRIRVNCIAPGSIEFPGGSWEKRKSDNPQFYNLSCEASRLAGSASRKRWARSRCSSHRRSLAG